MGLAIAGILGIIIIVVIVLLYFGVIGTGYAAKKGVDQLEDEDEPPPRNP